MKGKRYSEEQILRVLKEIKGGQDDCGGVP